MARKRVTQLLPFLIPIRQRQRKTMFYLGMMLDGRTYAKTLSQERMPHTFFETRAQMINEKSGFPMEYQYNKVHNLRLLAACLDGLIIAPGETFSFYQLARHADKNEPYRDGLNLDGGEIIPSYGGGLCQMSNLLHWLFLHTPLEMVERHSHGVESFPGGFEGLPVGIDAAICEGWKDLKAVNNTDETYQLSIQIDEDELVGRLLCVVPAKESYQVFNGAVSYFEKDSKVFERAEVKRRDKNGHETLLYENLTRIAYSLDKKEVLHS